MVCKLQRDLDSLPATIRECLAVWEAFRRLGFPASDLYLACIEEDLLGIQIRNSHGEFTVCVGPRPAENPCSLWEEAAVALRTATPEMRERHWWGSAVAKNSVPLLSQLAMRGFIGSAAGGVKVRISGQPVE